MSATSNTDGLPTGRWSAQLASRLSRATRISLFDAWVIAAFEAKVALEVWCASVGEERAGAYVHYCAALDREERAAGMLAAAAG
jgi:hypothetical protein